MKNLQIHTITIYIVLIRLNFKQTIFEKKKNFNYKVTINDHTLTKNASKCQHSYKFSSKSIHK